MPACSKILKIHRSRPDWKRVREAAALVRRGEVIAMPTDTLYGLAGDPFLPGVPRRIFEIKRRPETRPIPLLISDREQLRRLARDVPELLYRLAGRFWPGPLTVVLQATPEVPDAITAGTGTVAVRLPEGPLVRALVREAGGCVTGTSANISGQPAALTAEEAKRQLGADVSCIVDGGPAGMRVPSTLLDLTSAPKLLRHGAIPWGRLARFLK